MKCLPFFALTLILLLGASTINASADEVTEKPALKVTTLDGKSFDLAQQRGHWVIVNFWATWCSPCLKEIPDISAFVASRKDVVAIGLDFEEIEIPDLKAFIKDHPIGYPVSLVDVSSPPKDFEAPRGLPTTYLIAPDGRVAKRFTGPVTSRDIGDAIKVAAGSKAA